MRIAAAAGLIFAAGALAASCALAGFERGDSTAMVTTSSSTAGAGGEGGMGGAGGEGGMPCQHAVFPEPPSVVDAGGGIEFVSAIRGVVIPSDEVAAAAIGYDIDRICTCQGEGAGCVPPGGLDRVCDHADGRDNAAVSLTALLATALGADISTAYSEGAEGGAWTVLIRVQGYNGESDDDEVSLHWYLSPGFDALMPGAVPIWDGSDQWPVSEASLEDGMDIDLPIQKDESAYVVDGMVVSSLTAATVILAGSMSFIELSLTAGAVLAHIEPVGATWRLTDGVITGRINEEDLFNAISSFRDDMGTPLCTDAFVYPFSKTEMCSARDILTGAGGPTLPCDALSFAFGFDAAPAHLGQVAPAATPTQGCDPGLDPADDSCD